MLSTVRWLNPAGGDWDVAANRESGAVPGPNDDVTVDVGNVTIGHSSNISDAVKSVTATSPITLSAGTLSVSGLLSDSANLAMAGGTLASATIAPGTTLKSNVGLATYSTVTDTLRDVTIAGSFEFYNAGDTVNVQGAGLRLDGGTIYLSGANDAVNFSGGQALGGTGTVRFDGGSIGVTGQGSALTIAPGIAIEGGLANGTASINAGPGTIDVQGTINVANANSPRAFYLTSGVGGSFVNHGTMKAGGGGILDLSGTWTNAATGRLVADSGSLRLGGDWHNLGTLTSQGPANVSLGGSITLANLGAYSRDAAGRDLFVLTGTLNLAGDVLDNKAGPGDWSMVGATIVGGTINVVLHTNTSLATYSVTTDTLSGVTIGGSLDFFNDDAVNIAGAGLTLAGGTIALRAGSLRFRDTQSLGGAGTVSFQGGALGFATPGGLLGLGPGVAIACSGGFDTIDAGTGHIDIVGPIHANGGHLRLVNDPGGSATLSGAIDLKAEGRFDLLNNWAIAGATPIVVDGFRSLLLFQWTGTDSQPINVTNNGEFSASTTSWANAVPISVDHGRLTWSGSWSSSAPITAVNNSYVALDGDWTNSGPVSLSGTITIAGTWSNSSTIQVNTSSFAAVTVTWTNTGTLAGSTKSTLNLVDSVPATGTVSLATQSTLNSNGTSWSSTSSILADNSSVNLVGDWSNAGTIAGVSVSTITLGGNRSNTGLLSQVASTLTLGGSFKTTGLGTIRGKAGTTTLTGTLTNDGTFAIDDSTGPIYLYRGTILGGVVTTSGSARVLDTGGTLDGVTLAGTLDGSTFVAPTLVVVDGLTLVNAQVLLDHANLEFRGAQTLGGTGTVRFLNSDNSLNGSTATLTVPSSSDHLTIGPGITLQGSNGSIGFGSDSINNQGTIRADGFGTLYVYHPTNYANATLTGGTWGAINGSRLQLEAIDITTNAATLAIDGPTSNIYRDGGTGLFLRNLAANATSGSISITGGSTQASSAALANSGLVAVGPGSRLTLPSYSQSGGLTQLAGGTLDATDGVMLQGGTMSGPGTVRGDLVNAAAIDLGPAPGILSVVGNYVQAAGGSLTVKVDGSSASQYDQLNASGSATLDGTLHVALGAGYGPRTGQAYQILHFSGSSGGFATLDLPSINGEDVFAPLTSATHLDLIGLASSPDLFVGSTVVSPNPSVPGEGVTFGFTVTNLGLVARKGWTDSVYLSADATLSADDVLLGRVDHAGDLGSLASYQGSVTAPLPGAGDGPYHLIVATDSGLQVRDADRSNNVAASPVTIQARVTPLTLGMPVTGTIVEGQDIFYKVNVPPGANVSIASTFAAAIESEFVVRFGSSPTRSGFDFASSSLYPRITLPDGKAGPYYIVLHGREGAKTPQSYTIQAMLTPFDLASFDSQEASYRAESVTMHLTGSGFTADTRISLEKTGASIAPKTTTFVDSGHLTVNFDLLGSAAGLYTVVARDGIRSSQASSTFVLRSSSIGPILGTIIISPGAVPVGSPIVVDVTYTNFGDADLQLPSSLVTGQGATLVSPTSSLFPGSILAPHQSLHVGLVFQPTGGRDSVSTFTLGASGKDAVIDWASQEAKYRPSDVSPDV